MIRTGCGGGRLLRWRRRRRLRLKSLLDGRLGHYCRVQVPRVGRRAWRDPVRQRLLACVLNLVLHLHSLLDQRCCVVEDREAEAVVSILARPHLVGLLTLGEERSLGRCFQHPQAKAACLCRAFDSMQFSTIRDCSLWLDPVSCQS